MVHPAPGQAARGRSRLDARGAVAAVGFDFLVLGADGRIRLDYQFLDRPPAP